MASQSEIRWLPLESNPEVMNKYAARLGVSGTKFIDVIDLNPEYLKQEVTSQVYSVLLLFPRKTYVKALGVPETWQFFDVFGFDPELLCMVPRPVSAVVMLYPLSDKTEGTKLGEEDQNKDVYYMKQTIGNACGTVGLIHALCNNTGNMTLDETKHLNKFYQKTKDMSPDERGKYLESDKEFGKVHDESAQEGQTAAPSRDDKVNLHFVAFVHHNGGLYELDGRKGAPVKHGVTTPDTLLEDTVGVVKKFMALDPENLNFTVVALAKA